MWTPRPRTELRVEQRRSQPLTTLCWLFFLPKNPPWTGSCHPRWIHCWLIITTPKTANRLIVGLPGGSRWPTTFWPGAAATDLTRYCRRLTVDWRQDNGGPPPPPPSPLLCPLPLPSLPPQFANPTHSLRP